MRKDNQTAGIWAQVLFAVVLALAGFFICFPLSADAATITAAAGTNGTITPSGTVTVTDGTDQTFTITPDPNYHVADVLVDGASVGAVPTYTFSSVSMDHTISASFAIDTRTITASAGANGSISPSGAVIVDYGSTQSFLITPDPGYQLVSIVTGSGCSGTYSGSTFTTGAITVDCTVAANFTPLSDGFESGNFSALPWVLGGNANWFVQNSVARYGTFAAQSGAIANSQNSSIQVTLNITSPGYVYFWVKTSTEHIYDYVQFYVDGSTAYSTYGGWSGATDWTMVRSVYTVPAGVHTFKWQYNKDSSGSSGSDAVWIDNISFPPFGITSFTVTPSAGPGGSISPATPVSVNQGLTTSFTVTPDAGYRIAGVTGCNGTLSADTYTTGPINGDCTVTATFALNTYTINASSDSNGSISPSGAVIVNSGADQSFSITADTGYLVSDVLVDGSSVGPVSSYTFTNVVADHTIAASTAVDPNGPPVFNSTSPVSNGFINSAAAGYVLSKDIVSGTVTFTRIGGTLDPGSPHIYNMTAPDMTAGSHTVNTGFSLTNGSIYSVSFDGVDSGSRAAATVTNTNILFDASAAAVTLDSPASSIPVNNATVGYTLSKDVGSGSIVYTQTGGSGDGDSPHTYTLSGPELASGSHSVPTGLALVNGAVYTVSIQNVVDLEGNSSAVVSNTNIAYDITAVAITNTAPLATGVTSTTTVSYTLSEEASSGRVTFTQTGGSSDTGSPHVYTFSGGDLAAGVHTITTDLPLSDGSIYTVSFDATDLAGNNAATVSNGSVMFDRTPPVDGTVTAAPGNTQNAVSWSGFNDAASGVSSYILVSSSTGTPANCSGTSLYAGSAMSYTDTGLTNGTTSYYRVCAVDYAGNISTGATANGTPRPDSWTVTADAGQNGTISCNPATVLSGGSSDCTITPNTGYFIVDVSVGPTSGTLSTVGAVSAWTINNITTNMTISAAFGVNTYMITASAGANGSISCSPATVAYGSSSVCMITPQSGYRVADVAVGPTGGTLSSVGAVSSYTISGVSQDMSITASFTAASGTPPTARFTWGTDPNLNYTVLFDGSSSTCPSGTTCTYAWAFGDGSSGSDVTTAHTYSGTASVTVTLTVTNPAGAGTYSLTVTPKYVASLPTSLTAGASTTGFTTNVTFAVTGGVAPYTIKITWGDGTSTTSSSASATVSHTYGAAGTYSGSVYAIDSGVNGSMRTSATSGFSVSITLASISGTATRADSTTPIASAYVYLMQGSTTKKIAVTATNGTFNFTNVPAGSYTLKAVRSGYTFPTPTVDVGSANISGINISSTQ